MTSNNNYIGNELELFKNATNWKKYFSSIIAEYIHGDVLEVGAGIGINTNYLVNNSKISSITCIEPDPTLCLQIKKNHKETNITENEIINGKLPVSMDVALRLGKYYSMDPKFWFNLQTEYDSRKAKRDLI